MCHNPCGDATVKWKRAPELVKREGAGRAKLFEGRIEADDVKQGGLGDCWLLSAIASAAEAHPELIRGLFVTPFVEPCGVYRVRLYDVRFERWTTVVIDDRIPMDDAGTAPRFTQPNGARAVRKLLGGRRVIDTHTPQRHTHPTHTRHDTHTTRHTHTTQNLL